MTQIHWATRSPFYLTILSLLQIVSSPSIRSDGCQFVVWSVNTSPTPRVEACERTSPMVLQLERSDKKGIRSQLVVTNPVEFGPKNAIASKAQYQDYM
jgi:hypothetical protein